MEPIIVTEEYSGPDRRREPHITQKQIDDIAEKAAELAVSKLMDTGFKAVGKTVIEKLFWIVGVLAIGGYLWLESKGHIK